jgi:hypothetical protein
LIIFKPREIYSTEYEFDGTTVTYRTKPVNASIGCDMPWTIQLIENRLTWCNSYAGVHTLVSSAYGVKDERNVQPISRNINGNVIRPGLLQETNLTFATSIDIFGMYWVCVGNKAWIWDYSARPYQFTGNSDEDAKKIAWFPQTNINAYCWLVINNELYYGDRAAGKIIHFVNNFCDFDLAIEGKYRIPFRDFGYPDWLKTVLELRITGRSDTYTIMDIVYYDENNPNGQPDTQPVNLSSFNWSTVSWNTWIWQVIHYGKTFFRKPNKKKILYFAVEFSNNVAGRDMSIMDIILRYRLDKRVK